MEHTSIRIVSISTTGGTDRTFCVEYSIVAIIIVMPGLLFYSRAMNTISSINIAIRVPCCHSYVNTTLIVVTELSARYGSVNSNIVAIISFLPVRTPYYSDYCRHAELTVRRIPNYNGDWGQGQLTVSGVFARSFDNAVVVYAITIGSRN